MASERQIAANRRNALSSSGPRSRAGKRRSSGNSLRHGLSRIINTGAGAEIEALARLLVGADVEEEKSRARAPGRSGATGSPPDP